MEELGGTDKLSRNVVKHYQYTLRKSRKSTDLIYTHGNLNDANKYDLSGFLPDLQASPIISLLSSLS